MRNNCFNTERKCPYPIHDMRKYVILCKCRDFCLHCHTILTVHFVHQHYRYQQKDIIVKHHHSQEWSVKDINLEPKVTTKVTLGATKKYTNFVLGAGAAISLLRWQFYHSFTQACTFCTRANSQCTDQLQWIFYHLRFLDTLQTVKNMTNLCEITVSSYFWGDIIVLMLDWPFSSNYKFSSRCNFFDTDVQCLHVQHDNQWLSLFHKKVLNPTDFKM